MVYRLVYRDSSDILWVQYGAAAYKQRPQFLQIHHARPDCITVHPSIESAEDGISRFNDIDATVIPRIQFACHIFDPVSARPIDEEDWNYLVDEELLLRHITDLIAC